MSYSIEAILAAFPNGLTFIQIRKMIYAAGFGISYSELSIYLHAAPEIELKGKKFYKKDQPDVRKRKQKQKELTKAVSDFTNSLQNFMKAQTATKDYITEDSSSWDEKSEEDSDSDSTTNRKFWEKKPKEPKPWEERCMK